MVKLMGKYAMTSPLPPARTTFTRKFVQFVVCSVDFCVCVCVYSFPPCQYEYLSNLISCFYNFFLWIVEALGNAIWMDINPCQISNALDIKRVF